MPVQFRGRLYGQDEIIEAGDELSAEEREQLEALAQRRYIKVLDDAVKHTADMAPEPAGRGYKRR